MGHAVYYLVMIAAILCRLVITDITYEGDCWIKHCLFTCRLGVGTDCTRFSIISGRGREERGKEGRGLERLQKNFLPTGSAFASRGERKCLERKKRLVVRTYMVRFCSFTSLNTWNICSTQ